MSVHRSHEGRRKQRMEDSVHTIVNPRATEKCHFMSDLSNIEQAESEGQGEGKVMVMGEGRSEGRSAKSATCSQKLSARGSWQDAVATTVSTEYFLILLRPLLSDFTRVYISDRNLEEQTGKSACPS